GRHRPGRCFPDLGDVRAGDDAVDCAGSRLVAVQRVDEEDMTLAAPQLREVDGDRPLTARQQEIRTHFDRIAGEREAWLARNRFFYEGDRAYMRFLIP